MPPFRNRIGEKHGRLTVLDYDETSRGRNARWICQCDCGKIVTVYGHTLESGHTKSCGCLKLEMLAKRSTIHGDSGKNKSKLYTTYHNMMQRTHNKNSPDYRFYKNVEVCDEWASSYLVFKEWALNNGYEDGLTLDRIDVYGNYEPSNCRWVTWDVQHNNTRSNKMLEYNGEVKSMADWCRELDLPYYTIRSRINILKWDAKTAFETPIKKRDTK